MRVNNISPIEAARKLWECMEELWRALVGGGKEGRAGLLSNVYVALFAFIDLARSSPKLSSSADVRLYPLPEPPLVIDLERDRRPGAMAHSHSDTIDLGKGRTGMETLGGA